MEGKFCHLCVEPHSNKLQGARPPPPWGFHTDVHIEGFKRNFRRPLPPFINPDQRPAARPTHSKASPVHLFLPLKPRGLRRNLGERSIGWWDFIGPERPRPA